MNSPIHGYGSLSTNRKVGKWAPQQGLVVWSYHRYRKSIKLMTNSAVTRALPGACTLAVQFHRSFFAHRQWRRMRCAARRDLEQWLRDIARFVCNRFVRLPFPTKDRNLFMVLQVQTDTSSDTSSTISWDTVCVFKMERLWLDSPQIYVTLGDIGCCWMLISLLSWTGVPRCLVIASADVIISNCCMLGKPLDDGATPTTSASPPGGAQHGRCWADGDCFAQGGHRQATQGTPIEDVVSGLRFYKTCGSVGESSDESCSGWKRAQLDCWVPDFLRSNGESGSFLRMINISL